MAWYKPKDVFKQIDPIARKREHKKEKYEKQLSEFEDYYNRAMEEWYAKNPNSPGYGVGDRQKLLESKGQPGGGITRWIPGQRGGQQSAQDYYNRGRNLEHTRRLAGTTPGMQGYMYDADPAKLGDAQLSAMMADPYNYGISDASRRSSMEGTELAYNRAGREAAGTTLRSGAGRGGVARGMRGNIAMARGADQASNIREYDQFKQRMGDSRMQSLLMPYMQMVNQSWQNPKGAGKGGPAQLSRNEIVSRHFGPDAPQEPHKNYGTNWWHGKDSMAYKVGKGLTAQSGTKVGSGF